MGRRQPPRLRTVERYEPPYRLNRFPRQFVGNLAREIAYILATEAKPVIEGKRWEQIFASSVGAEWQPSNVGLDDVRLEQCAWGCKTVLNAHPANATVVRLISGRNSPAYSYDLTDIRSVDPAELAAMVLEIWNERVSAVRARYHHLRTVTLLKRPDLMEFAVFEADTVMYDAAQYVWSWNRNNNLEGHDGTGRHRFTWQPHGSQFTIVEPVPADRTAFAFRRRPELPDRDRTLAAMGFTDEWIEVLPGRGA